MASPVLDRLLVGLAEGIRQGSYAAAAALWSAWFGAELPALVRTTPAAP